MHTATDDIGATNDKDGSHSHGAEHLGEWTAKLFETHHTVHTASVIAECVGEAESLAALAAEGLDNTYACDVLLKEREKRAELVLSFQRVALETLAHHAHKEKKYRRHQQEIEKERGAYEKKGCRKDDNVDRRLKERLDGADDAPLNIGNVVGHTAEEVATALTLEISDWEYGNLMEDIIAKTLDYTIADRADAPCGEKTEEVGEERAEKKGERNGDEAEEEPMGGTPLAELPVEPFAEVVLI